MATHSTTEAVTSLVEPVKVLYISTYIPRRCGLATYTKDLTNGINLINPLALAKIVAMDNGGSDKINYPHEVTFRVKQEDWDMYKRVARYINKSSEVEIVSLQHEFGIFGGDMGEKVCDFMRLLKKPVVSTLHTVVESPGDKQKAIIKEICRLSKYVVVMIGAASEILERVYGVDRSKVAVIHHGVPDFPNFDIDYWKRRHKLHDRVVMSSINLLSEGKGIEYAIEAVPGIVKKIPNFLYLVVGQTHPGYLKNLKKTYGKDIYREKLEVMVKKLNISKNVRFINRYVTLGQLVSYIAVSDFYITPYLDKQQAASGSLAYAIGGGDLCISTPYLYAKEMLSGGRGVIVPFRNSKKIAEAVIKINGNPDRMRNMENKTYEQGRRMTWNNIAHQYFHLFQGAVNGS